MILVQNLFEAHLTVADLDRSVAFYRDVVGLQSAHVTSTRQAAFFWIGPEGNAMLGLWLGGVGPQRTTMHVAFRVSAAEVIAAPDVLRSAGITPLDFGGQPTDEPVVIAWMPALSVFFHDPDGHLLEYIAMLPDTPRPQDGVVPWHAWRSTDSFRIRLARPDEIVRLRVIEDEAGTMFSGLGLIEDALDASFPIDELVRLVGMGQVWVGCTGDDEEDRPVGMVIASVREEAAYVEELDVMPKCGRRGLGSRLLSCVCAWAQEQRYASVTLSTFRDVPWNGPFYRKRGFRDLQPAKWTPGMRAIRDMEVQHGLKVEARVFMRRCIGRTATLDDGSLVQP